MPKSTIQQAVEKQREKNKGGRPTKLTEAWLATARQIIDADDIASIIHTDEELLTLINAQLEREERYTEVIDYLTFKRWKAKALGTKTGDTLKKDSNEEIFSRFCTLYQETLQKQKANLFKELKKDGNGWQRFAWIIERKFSNWNLKTQQEMRLTGGLSLSHLHDAAEEK